MIVKDDLQGCCELHFNTQACILIIEKDVGLLGVLHY
jgi:hypothetical protein